MSGLQADIVQTDRQADRQTNSFENFAMLTWFRHSRTVFCIYEGENDSSYGWLAVYACLKGIEHVFNQLYITKQYLCHSFSELSCFTFLVVSEASRLEIRIIVLTQHSQSTVRNRHQPLNHNVKKPSRGWNLISGLRRICVLHARKTWQAVNKC